MKKFFLLGLTLFFGVVYAQSNKIDVPFSEIPPVIDGLPDASANTIPWQDFSNVSKTNEQNPGCAVRYKMFYGCTFLYILIEAESDSITVRDRAYQNGDGFHLVIAKPRPDGIPTDEFYVLRFTPGNPAKETPPKKSIWYYNVDLSGKLLSSSTKLECKTDNCKSYFELLLSWDDVYPYHPLLSENIGLNLCFVKAIGEKDKNYYFLKYDERIQNELSKREYITASFEKPEIVSDAYYTAKSSRRNIQTGENLNIIFTTLAVRPEKLNFNYGIYSAGNTEMKKSNEEVQTVSGLNTKEFNLPVSDLPSGDYIIKWNVSDRTEGNIPLTILPVINYEYEKSALGKLKNKTNEGGYNTLMFMLQDVMNNYKSVKPYETASFIRKCFQTYKSYVTGLESGTDSLKLKRGTFRRAFLSGIDKTLQPYSVKVPENYNSSNKYPLFVMLHGSGSDDTEMLTGTALTENNFIEIAPNGRGTSNCFTVDSAQADIKEAIEDAIKNYSIDTSRIIIAGFSMGGYGAYRTYFEHPGMFRAVAVFSGHPNLPSKWFGEGFPDFLNDEYLKPFKGIPVFVYHSKNDLNCPYELTQQLVSKLTKAGAKVKFVVSDESGHGIINKENIPVYYQWLKSVY